MKAKKQISIKCIEAKDRSVKCVFESSSKVKDMIKKTLDKIK